MQENVKQVTEVRFKLNPSNPKDMQIINLLNNEYNANEYIKALLYKISIGGNIGQLTSFMVNQGNTIVNDSVTEVVRKCDDIPLDDTLGQNGEDEEISNEVTNEFAEFFG